MPSASPFPLRILALITLFSGAVNSAPVTEKAPQPGDEYRGVAIKESALRSNTAGTTLLATVRIDENTVIKPFTKQLLGYNFDWEGNSQILPDPKTGQIDPRAAELLQGVPFPLNRFAGGESQRFAWKGTIGPVDQRPEQLLWKWAKPHRVLPGLLETWQWIQRLDPKAELTWVPNLDQELDSNYAELAAFLTGRPESVPPEVKAWAQRRIDLGVKEPMPVAIWEIGNEMDIVGKPRWTIARYLAACKKAIREIRTVDKHGKIAVTAASAPWNPGYAVPGQPWQQWHRELLRELGPQLDYIVFHPYYSGHPTSMMEECLNEIRDDIKKITGSDRIKLYISEHARWPDLEKKKHYQSHSLEGCLAASQFLLRCLNRPDVGPANYHSFSSFPWGMIYRDKPSGQLYTTGIADLFRLYGKIPGGQVVQLTLDGAMTDPIKTNLSFTAGAVRDGETLYVMLNNMGPARAVTLTTKRPLKIAESWIFTGAGPDAYNRYGQKEINLGPWDGIKKGAALDKLTVPSGALILLKVE